MDENPDTNATIHDVKATKTKGATFKINYPKLYVAVITFSIDDNIKLLEKIKQQIKRTISWNKYRFEITTQPKNNNLDYLVDPKFKIIDRF